jgi:uncharacterized protein (TIRG00374 family)
MFVNERLSSVVCRPSSPLTPMRRLLLGLLLLAATVFLLAQAGNLQSFAQVLAQGRPGWIALALGVQALWQLNVAAQWRAAHRSVGADPGLGGILPAALANHFVLVAAPTGSVSTFALFLANARQRGLPAARVTTAVMLFAVFEDLGLSALLAAGLVVLWQRGELNALAVAAALGVFGLTLALAGTLALGLWARPVLERLLNALAGLANRLSRRWRRRDLLAPERVPAFLDEAAEGLASFRQRGGGWESLLVSLSGKALLVALLGLTALAFGQSLSLPVLVTAAGLTGALTVVSPTPLGVGIAEGALALSLSSLGVPLEAAAAISLTYRGLTLWLPMLYGFGALQASGLRLARH